jgi:uncharacterized protein (TIGR00725 family)
MFGRDREMPRFIVGVMGQGEGASREDEAHAELLGELVAREQWVLLTGGRDAGIMRAASRGAKRVPGSLTVGILPNRTTPPSPHVDVAIITDMNEARNNINVLSSNVIVACGRVGPGTTSEIALALKAGKPVLLLGGTEGATAFFQNLSQGKIINVDSAQQAIEVIRSRFHV